MFSFKNLARLKIGAPVDHVQYGSGLFPAPRRGYRRGPCPGLDLVDKPEVERSAAVSLGVLWTHTRRTESAWWPIGPPLLSPGRPGGIE